MRLQPDDLAVLARLSAGGDRLVSRAVAWCQIASGSRNLDGLERQRIALEHELGRLPGEVETLSLPALETIDGSGRAHVAPASPALRLTVRPRAPRQVALTGHFDTVYPASSAFQSVRSRHDGALNGPGIADMKGGISVLLGALEAFETHPLASGVGYQVLLSPDEEIGSPGSAAVLSDLAARAHLGMTFEPCMPDGALIGSRPGSGNFDVIVRGRAAHVGRAFAKGRNAVVGAARLAARLDALNGVHEGVTLNVARVDGGGELNVTPALAVLRFNVRAVDATAAEWMRRRIDEAVVASTVDDLTLTVHGGFHRPPKPETPTQTRLLETVSRIGALLDVSLEWRSSGGVCEGNNLFAAGLPNIDTLGVRGGDIHSEAEFAWPASFTERAALSAAILMKAASDELDIAALRHAREVERTSTVASAWAT